MNSIQIIAFTHRQFKFDEIGVFHLEDENRIHHLSKLKEILEVSELMYLSTCNRVEFVLYDDNELNNQHTINLINYFTSINQVSEPSIFNDKVEIYKGKQAVHHLFSVASSLDSLVLGEREIITQVRQSYEECKVHNLCGDIIRVLIDMTIQTAKKVYTESKIATRPVSLVSLAYKELKKYLGNQPKNIMVVGAGKTITSLLKFLSKTNQHNYIIYNRSLSKANEINDLLNLNAKVCSIDTIGNNPVDFDIIISATASKEPILDNEKYALINPNNSKTTIVDLAVPKDCHQEMSLNNNIRTINVDQLKERADENLKLREKEINNCLKIIDDQIVEYNIFQKERKLERAMSAVPESIKGIRKKAYAEVFAKELENLDPNAREVLDSFLDYMEKKYISVPMKMAKDILLKQSIK